MKKIDVGQTISILANAGVIAGIVFLALELRQNNEWLASESRYYHTLAREAWHEHLATDEQLAGIIAKTQRGENLSIAEQIQLTNFYFYLFTQWEWEYRQDQLGRTEVSIEGYRSVFDKNPTTNLPSFPGVREAWELNRMTWSEEFRQFMDESIVH